MLLDRAGPALDGSPNSWSQLVSWLTLALDFVTEWTSKLFMFFMTPIGDLVDVYSPGLSGVLIQEIFDLFRIMFGYDFAEITFIELTLGFMLPFILVYTIYRYVT